VSDQCCRGFHDSFIGNRACVAEVRRLQSWASPSRPLSCIVYLLHDGAHCCLIGRHARISLPTFCSQVGRGIKGTAYPQWDSVPISVRRQPHKRRKRDRVDCRGQQPRSSVPVKCGHRHALWLPITTCELEHQVRHGLVVRDVVPPRFWYSQWGREVLLSVRSMWMWVIDFGGRALH
jgi:hypothetical protein